MNADKRAEVIARLEKILAKADSSRNPSQAEVETAMRLAQKIATENNLDIAAVMAAKKPDDKTPVIKTDKVDCSYRSSQKLEHEYIFRVLMKCFDVLIIRFGKTGFCIVGEATDAQIARFCFTFLQSMFSKLALRHAKERGLRHYGSVATQTSFYAGMEAGIVESNRKVKEEVQSQSYALVLVDKKALVEARVHQEFPKLNYDKPVERQRDPYAERAGYATGRTIKLQHQIS